MAYSMFLAGYVTRLPEFDLDCEEGAFPDRMRIELLIFSLDSKQRIMDTMAEAFVEEFDSFASEHGLRRLPRPGESVHFLTDGPRYLIEVSNLVVPDVGMRIFGL
jgi:hypothetical protein